MQYGRSSRYGLRQVTIVERACLRCSIQLPWLACAVIGVTVAGAFLYSLRKVLAMLAGLLVLVVLLTGGSRLPSVAGLYIGALALTLYLGAEVLGLRVLLAGRGASPAGAVGARRSCPVFALT